MIKEISLIESDITIKMDSFANAMSFAERLNAFRILEKNNFKCSYIGTEIESNENIIAIFTIKNEKDSFICDYLLNEIKKLFALGDEE